MYIARLGDRHILKRMPDTGPQHDADCDSYEPPPALSGLATVEGKAIVENIEDGTTLIKLGFSLSKLSGRSTPASGESVDAGDARTDGARLSLKALLHFLWDRAGFNRWRPAMAGRRNWAVLRKYLLEIAAGSTAKGKPLADSLYIPEMFDPRREDAIFQRRLDFFSRAIRSQGNRRSLAMLVGEVKEIAAARLGAKLIVKHAPRFPFMLADDIHRRMTKVFAGELAVWDASSDSHLIAIATFGTDVSGIASIEAIALMAVDTNWIPFDSRYEAMLVEALTRSGASFVKTLRYNLPRSQPMASVILTGQGGQSSAMYLVPDNANASYRETLDALIAESGMRSWVWDIVSGPMPELPSRSAASDILKNLKE